MQKTLAGLLWPGYLQMMPRTARSALGGLVYHVLNRANGRTEIFRTSEDYQAFLELLIEGKEHAEIDVFGFCLMSTHWHLVLRPRRGKDLAGYLSWVTNTHVKRYRAHYSRTSGHLYQGRFKSFPVQEDSYFLALQRYVAANPLRAKRVERAEQWPWSSLGCELKLARKLLNPWPVNRPRGWVELVNRPLPEVQYARIQTSFERGRPLGDDAWTAEIAKKLGMEYTLNPRGRPPKKR